MKNVGFVKKWFMALVSLMMLGQQQHALAQAQAVAPIANYVVNRAIAGTIAKVALQRGFAANDARIAATMVGVGSSMTAVNVASTVGGIALAVAGAPVWLTVLGGLGILAAGAAIVAGSTSLKVDSGAVTVSGGTASTPTYTPPTSNGGGSSLGNPTGPTGNPIIDALLRDGTRIYRTAGCQAPNACTQFPLEVSNWVARRVQLCDGNECTGGPFVALYFSEQEFIDHMWDGAYWTTPTNGDGTGMTRRSTKTWEVGYPGRSVNESGIVTLGGWYDYVQVCKIWDGTSGTACDPGYDISYRDTYWTSNDPRVTVRVLPGGSTSQQYSSLDAATSGMSAEDKAKSLSPDALARIVDAAWSRAASQPGYQGLPYSATQPVTPAEVSTWQNENPGLNPTLGDLLVPAVAPGTVSVPISPDVSVSPNPSPNPDPGTGGDPTPAPAGTTNVNVVNVPTVRVDWGADPGIGTPSLEQTPSASAILTPLLNLMPALRNFAVPAHNSVCPKPSFSMFGKQIVMDTHCAVLDDVKPTLYAVMAFVWLMLGAIIILRA
jgi:hypothetical protein